MNEEQQKMLRTAAHNLEVAANTCAYCYTRNPGNFALALTELKRDAEIVRHVLSELPA